MGFNKRFITKDLIERTPEGLLMELFNSDLLIMDEWSQVFYDKFINKKNH